MQVRVLGPIEVIDGHRLAIGGPRQRRILAVLAMHTGEVVSVDRLAEVAWAGDDPPDTATANVRSYVNRIRDGLGGVADRLVTTAPGYVLELGVDELDAAQLTASAVAAEQAVARGNLEAALGHTDRAIELWHGRPYAEFADEAWAQAEVQRLEETRLHVLELRCEAQIELGQPERALEQLEVLVAEQPYRERLRRLQMLALYHCRREPEALRVFHDFRSLLADEVGVSPSTELVELDRRIVDHDPALRRPEQRPRHVRDYELHDVIGEGAFAMVWRGTQPVLDREVAVKQIREQLANDAEFIRRFEVEARIVSALEHPFVVPLYDYWREPGAAFLVMRMLTGGTLETRLHDGPLREAELKRLVEQIGAALQAAHRRGIIHRDVKPGNILLDGEGNFFLTDFGIAFGIGDESDDAAAAALSTGSPAYAAPEQLRREALDARTDIYAFGITVFEAATGQVPFEGEQTRAGLVRRQLDEAIPAPSTVRPSVAPWVDRVVTGATDKHRDDRFGDIAELIAAMGAPATPDGPAGAGATMVIGELRNPFKGLSAFTEADANDFRGRQRLIARLLDALRRPGSEGRLVAAVGPSGSGKSSVVRAGLLPELRRGAIDGSEQWFFTTMVPGAHPFEELESALVRVAAAPPGPLAELMSGNERGIARAVKQVIPDEDAELVLVIDQFEELFTLVADEAERRRFIDGLIGAIREPRSRLRIVATVRADFWDRPLRYPTLAALLETAAVTVTPLSADELERVIVDPVAEQGMAYEPGLVARISAEVVDQPGALPLLQYTLTQLFDRQVSGLLTAAAYDELGGVAGSIAGRAEEMFGELTPDQQVATRRLFGRLVTLGEGVEDTRRRVALAELGTEPATQQVIDRFGRARLLAFDRDPVSRAPTVEVAHEALIREWPRLRGWLDDDRDVLRVHRHLTDAATAWDERDRDPAELYRGARLIGAEPLLATEAVTLTPTESEFLAASVDRRDAEADAERRRVQRLRRLVTATAVVAVFMLVAGVVALWQWNRADDQTARAEASAQEALDNAAEAARNAADAEASAAEADANAARADASAADADTNAALAEQRAIDAEAAERRADLERMRAVALATAAEEPTVSALLAVEAYRLDPSFDSLDALQRVLTETPGFFGTMGTGSYIDSVLLDDRTIATATETSLEIWDVPDQALVRSIDHATTIGTTVIAPAGPGRVAVLDVSRTSTSVYDVATGDVIATLQHRSGVNDLDVSPDGGTLAVALADGGVEIWSVDDQTSAATIEADPAGISFLAWHPSDDRIVAATLTGAVQLWDVATQELLWATEPPVEAGIVNQLRPYMLSISPNGERVAALLGSVNGRMHTIDVATGEPAFPSFSAQLDGFGTNDVVWTSDVTITASGRNSTVSIDLASGTMTKIIDEYGQTGLAVTYVPSVDRFAIAGPKRIELWTTDGSGPLRRALPYPPEHVDEFLAGRAGVVLTSLLADGTILQSIVDLSNPQQVYAFDLSTDPATRSVADIEGGVVIGAGDHTLELLPDFSVRMLGPDLEPLGTPAPLPFDFADIGGSPDGRFFAFGRQQGKADLYRSTGEFVATLSLGGEEFANAQVGPQFSSDGEYITLTTTDGRSGIWRTATAERVEAPEWMADTTAPVIGPWIFASPGDGTAQRYDPETFEPVGVPLLLNGFSQLAYATIDETNGRVAAGGGGPSGAKVFDLETGRQLGRDLPYAGGSVRIEFSNDGSVLTVPDFDVLGIWNYDTDTWSDIACRFAGRNLTADEWEQLGPRTIDYRPTCDEYPTDS